MHGVGGEEIGIRLLDGIKFVDVPLAGELVVYHHDGGCAVLVQLPQFFGGEYPCPVHLGEYFLYMADVIGRGQDIPQMRLVIVFQLLDHFFFCVLVQLEIGLERSQDAVLLSFHNLVVFVDGEVEGGHQLSVLPGFVNVELVVELAVPRQKIDNNPDGAYENKRLIYQISERELFVFSFEITHIG